MTDEPINHTEVTRTRQGVSTNRGRTRHNDWYDYAPTTHPAIGQNTFHCKRCGNLVLEMLDHDSFHEKLDELARLVESTKHEIPENKISEPVKGRTRPIVKESE